MALNYYIKVGNEGFEKTYKKFKRKVTKYKIIEECLDKKYYTKQSVIKRRKKIEKKFKSKQFNQ